MVSLTKLYCSLEPPASYKYFFVQVLLQILRDMLYRQRRVSKRGLLYERLVADGTSGVCDRNMRLVLRSVTSITAECEPKLG